MNDERTELIQSEVRQFKGMKSYELIIKWITRQMKRADSVSTIDFNKPLEPQLAYMKGTVEFCRKILKVIEHPERISDVSGDENAVENEQQ